MTDDLEKRVDRVEWSLEQLGKDYKEVADKIFERLEKICEGKTPACLEHAKEITDMKSDLKSLKKVVYGCEEENLEGMVEKIKGLQTRWKIAMIIVSIAGTPIILACVKYLFPHVKW